MNLVSYMTHNLSQSDSLASVFDDYKAHAAFVFELGVERLKTRLFIYMR